MIRQTLALLALSFTAPALAQADSPDWWLVYAKDRAGPAQFVDIAAMKTTAQGAQVQVQVLSVDTAGKEQRRDATIRCEGGQQAHSLSAFVCGSQSYRQQNGLNIRDFPPRELARIYFKTSQG